MRGEMAIASRALSSARPASETLLPAVVALLEEAGVALAAIDAFAVSVGPVRSRDCASGSRR